MVRTESEVISDAVKKSVCLVSMVSIESEVNSDAEKINNDNFQWSE